MYVHPILYSKLFQCVYILESLYKNAKISDKITLSYVFKLQKTK